MSFLHAVSISRISPLALVALAALVATTTLTSAARADEPPISSARSPHETTMTELGNQLEELRLRAKVEDAEVLIERRRRERNEGPRFGPGRLGRGSVVLSDLFGISSLPLAGVSGVPGVGGLLFTGPVAFSFATEGGSHASSIGVAPSFDVFVSDHVTVGGRVVALRNTSTYAAPSPTNGTSPATSTSSGYAVGIEPRVGYVLPLTDSLALWPQLGLGVNQSRVEVEGIGRTLSRGVAAELEVGLLVPLGRHVVVRLAPTLAYNHASHEGNALSGSLGDSDSIAAGVRGQLGLAF
jgi:hypothetical protein